MFLKQVASYVVSRLGEDLSTSCFIFPNRRSGLFFKQFLLKEIHGTHWSPGISTVNEFMQELSGMAISDSLELSFELYGIYSSIVEHPEPFDEFLPWSEIMISDFDTLDKYMADPVSVFRNIRELREIDERFGELEPEQVEFIRQFWSNFYQGKMTDEKEMFMTTWNLLPKLYIALRDLLLQKKEGYEGLLYRKAAEDGLERIADQSWTHYYFVGLNALSAAEKRIFTLLKNRGVATFFWDYDDDWISGEFREAGRFLRENISLFPPPDDAFSSMRISPTREVRIFNLPSNILQAKTVNKILEERDRVITDANDTAIVACEEDMLMPVLVSLPENVDLVNITMGYPFSNTPLNSFTEALLRLHRNVRRTKSGDALFYHKDVLSVLNHQYYILAGGSDPNNYVKIITGKNMVYVDPSLFGDEFSKLLFNSVGSSRELCDYLDKLLNYILFTLRQDEDMHRTALEKEYVLAMLSRLNKLKDLLDRSVEIEIPTFIRIFRRVLSGLKIPFTGEPLAGLQVMGILETRLLDFRHVIMLSLNEDIMPRASVGHSFIPYSLRYAYGLPTREDMDAIYAYYFYRVTGRAEKVDLLYNSASEGVRTGEMSRYLYQMIYEYGAEQIRPTLPVTSIGKLPVSIKKTGKILEVLDSYLASSDDPGSYLSPSSLNMYLECPLRFYFRKILKIREQDKLLEELDPIGFGNILHKTIFRLYSSFDSKEFISAKELEELKQSEKLDEYLLDEFRNEYFGGSSGRKPEGRNLVILAILKKYLFRIIDQDARMAPVRFVELENEYLTRRQVMTSYREEGIKVKLGGLIDRVDQLSDNTVRIIDYKTGNAGLLFESIDSLFDTENVKRSKEAFQAFVYTCLYHEKNPQSVVQPGLYVLRNMTGADYTPQFREGSTEKNSRLILSFNPHMEEFLERLDLLLTEIFNPEIPFAQTEVQKRCEHCDFNSICQREDD